MNVTSTVIGCDGKILVKISINRTNSSQTIHVTMNNLIQFSSSVIMPVFLGPDLQNILQFFIRLSSKFIVPSTYDSDLRHAKISLKSIIYEHYLRRSYDLASEFYLRKTLRPS